MTVNNYNKLQRYTWKVCLLQEALTPFFLQDSVMAQHLQTNWKLNILQPSTVLPLVAQAQIPLNPTQVAQREAPLLWQEKRPKLIINKPKWQGNIISIDLLSKAGCSCETEMLFYAAPSSRAAPTARWGESHWKRPPFSFSTHGHRGCSFTFCAPQKWRCSGTHWERQKGTGLLSSFRVKTPSDRVQSSPGTVIVLVSSADGEYSFLFSSASFMLKSLFSSKPENPTERQKSMASERKLIAL